MRTTSPSSPCSPTTAASPRCWRACRIPTARPRRAPSCARRASGQAGCVYALTLADSGAFIGCAGLDARPHGLELGYWIGEPYWRHGYATEAAHALVDLAFRATAIEALNVSCRVINAASRRVIHKCGFQYAGQGMMDSIVRRQGAGRALPARPQDLGQPEELGAELTYRPRVANKSNGWSRKSRAISKLGNFFADFIHTPRASPIIGLGSLPAGTGVHDRASRRSAAPEIVAPAVARVGVRPRAETGACVFANGTAMAGAGQRSERRRAARFAPRIAIRKARPRAPLPDLHSMARLRNCRAWR